jgi:hypothetical protein
MEIDRDLPASELGDLRPHAGLQNQPELGSAAVDTGAGPFQHCPAALGNHRRVDVGRAPEPDA